MSTEHIKLKMKNICILLLILCLFGIKAQAASPVSANGRLSVSGNKLVNEKGKTFVIKGVSTHGLAWYPEYVNKSAFQNLRDQWGVNTIRLALYTAEYNGYCTGGDKTSLMKCLNNGVKYATELGMYVIIDWHILSDGNPLTYKKQANAFFKTVSKKYANYNNVIYEICNEPNGTGGTWKNIKTYAETVIKTIRSQDKKAIIIVGTPTWSQDVEQAESGRIKGYTNIAYSFHFYAGTHQAAMRTRLEKILKKGLPVIVTEFGITDASGNGSVNTDQGDKWMTLLDKYHTGRVCWNLSNKNESSALIRSSCKKATNWKYSELSNQGKWLVKTYQGKLAKEAETKQTIVPEKSSSDSQTTPCAAKLKATMKAVNAWTSGASHFVQYKVMIKNTGTKTSKNWKLKVTFNKNVIKENSWCANYAVKGKTLTITPLNWNKKISGKQSIELGFILKTRDADKSSYCFVLTSE